MRGNRGSDHQYGQTARHKGLPRPSLLFVLIALFGSSVHAATSLSNLVDDLSIEQLADMVVTDTKLPQTPDSVTQKIVVIRRDDLDAMPLLNRNLADLVRFTSGQFVNVLSRNDANWGSYGGLGPKYNSYLLDGIPIDSFVDAMNLDSAAIERIEIHKGPASVLYSNYLTMDFAGNETPLAGITNFVLKSRIDKELTQFSAGYGSWNTARAQLYHQGRNGNLSYLLGTSYEHADYTQYGSRNSWLQTVSRPGYEKVQAFANLSYAFDRPDHTLSLFLHHTTQDGDMGRPNRDFSHRYDTINLTYSNRLNDHWNIQFKYGERHYDRGFANDNYPLNLDLARYENTRQTIRPMDLTLSWLHSENSVLTLGVDHQRVHYWTENRAAGVSSRDNDVESTSTGFFAQEKVQWGDWIFRAGLRHNVIRHDYSLLGGNVPSIDGQQWHKNLWSLGVRYNIQPGLALYGNAGSSFMVPAAKQIGGTVSSPTASGELPNPGLRPETGLGRDIGLDWQATSNLHLGTRVFLNTIEDAIVTSVVNASPSQTRSENAGSVRAHGIEFDLRYAPGSDFALFANATHIRSRLEQPGNPDQDGAATPFSPSALVNAGVTLGLPGRITVLPYFQWIGRYYDSASVSSRQTFGRFGIANLRLQHQWQPGVDIYVDLINLADRHYRMPFDFVAPGFNAFAGVRVSF